MTTQRRSYNDAIDCLNSLQAPFAVVEARRKAGIRPDAASLQEMRGYLGRLGYVPGDLDRLNIIHVAGTKGKGTTCAFVDSILARYRVASASSAAAGARAGGGPVLGKTGLCISPHLVAVRERIRIDSAPLSEETFARYFFEVWAALEASGPASDKPSYARFLTLLSFHVFLRERVDMAVFETGLGGEFDATNVVERPVVTGITTLGIDHVFALGDRIEQIAWHKAGILKPGCPGFTVEQVAFPSAAEVLQRRAKEKGVELQVVSIDPRLQGVAIRPDAPFQKRNASLAVALAETGLCRIDPSFKLEEKTLPKEFVEGLEQVAWRGRCEVVPDGKMIWHLDGAHTVDSLRLAGKWFISECAARSGPRVLIFNQQGRSEAVDFLEALHNAAKASDGSSFSHVIFCTNRTYAEAGYKRDFVNYQADKEAVEKLTVQRAFADKWSQIDPSADVRTASSIETAINEARSLSSGLKPGETVQAFITGSIHLVGGALGILTGADAL